MASSSASSSASGIVRHFIEMGFAQALVVKVIEEKGEENEDAILQILLESSAIEEDAAYSYSDQDSFDSEENFSDELSDGDNYFEIVEDTSDPVYQKDHLLSHLMEMGYHADDILTAIDRCGLETPIPELIDFIYSAQLARTDVACPHTQRSVSITRNSTHGMPQSSCFNHAKKRKYPYQREGVLHLPNPMVGFGLPGEQGQYYRKLPAEATGPPYIYYENVALAPKGVWETISGCLFDIGPEFVDSLHFSAAARKRGYVHNLPIQNRYLLRPAPPKTIQDALPSTRQWWPSWDPRKKFNCLQTCIGSAKLAERLRRKLEAPHAGSEPSDSVKMHVLKQCRKWNLVWVGTNKLAPLDPGEMEVLLGFPGSHTRGGGIGMTDRYKALGNSFQIDTVAYHLSVLKEMYPDGMNVLSLFSGIGGAEVALHKLGIRLKHVVSAESSESSRDIVSSWWAQNQHTNLLGELIHLDDVRDVTPDKVKVWITSFGGFDLIIGGSPCNNLAGSNRHTRDGLEGQHSSLFFEYVRIVKLVREMMMNRRY